MLALQFLPTVPVAAQDAVVADPKHYTVELENVEVRVVRIKYGPHEKSVMHEHSANVAVFLTDANGKFTLSDGKSVVDSMKAGPVQWDAGGKHLPENGRDQPFGLIFVELKGKRTSGIGRQGSTVPETHLVRKHGTRSPLPTFQGPFRGT